MGHVIRIIGITAMSSAILIAIVAMQAGMHDWRDNIVEYLKSEVHDGGNGRSILKPATTPPAAPAPHGTLLASLGLMGIVARRRMQIA